MRRIIGFHHNIAQHLTNKQPQQLHPTSKVWKYAHTENSLEEANLLPLKDYIDKHKTSFGPRILQEHEISNTNSTNKTLSVAKKSIDSIPQPFHSNGIITNTFNHQSPIQAKTQQSNLPNPPLESSF
jgi:hypothetical protein